MFQVCENTAYFSGGSNYPFFNRTLIGANCDGIIVLVLYMLDVLFTYIIIRFFVDKKAYKVN